MIRFAFTAYLSLMAALGPAFCCCNVRHMLSGSETSSCCGKMHTKAGPGADRHSHSHHGDNHAHGDHAHHHHAHVPTPASPADSNSLPQNHDGEDCPCGGQDELIAVVANDAQALALQNHGTLLFAVALPIQLQVSAVEATSIPQVRPSLLAGRELLRAYQIMRC